MNSPFPQTRWSQILALREDDAHQAERALAEICRDYWEPLYLYVRRAGNRPEDSEDLTQGFFSFLIEKNVLAQADQSRGKLRSFLLRSLKNYLSDQWDKRRALKRGGGSDVVSLDVAEFGRVEASFQRDPASSEATPDEAFDHQWALLVMRRVFQEVKAWYEARDQREIFDALHPFLTPQERGTAYREAGEKLGMEGSAVRVALFRMRQRYGEVLRRHLLETVASEAEIADEINALMVALRRG